MGCCYRYEELKKYLIGKRVVLKTDSLPLIRMIASYSILNIATLRWIAYIKSMNMEFKHIADILSQTRYDDEEDMMDGEVDLGTNFYSMILGRQEGVCLDTYLVLFSEELYENE